MHKNQSLEKTLKKEANISPTMIR